MLNNVVLIGRLARDPELRYTQGGKAVCNFTIAVNRFGGDTADFIPVVVWEKQAENISKYLSKGSLAAVEGRLQVRTYDDKEGTRRYATEVVARGVTFLDSKPKESQDDEPEEYSDEDVPF